MKTLAIILGVLAITMAVYGVDVARLKKFMGNLVKCSEELGVLQPEPTAEVLACASEKDGHVFNADGEYIKEEVIQALGDAISDSDVLEKAQEIFNECYEEAVNSGVIGAEQTLQISACSLAILPLLDQS